MINLEEEDAWLSLLHKRRASGGAGRVLEIMIHAAELPVPAA
jgi:hypothetical protein